jgi:hypothetical protein
MGDDSGKYVLILIKQLCASIGDVACVDRENGIPVLTFRGSELSEAFSNHGSEDSRIRVREENVSILKDTQEDEASESLAVVPDVVPREGIGVIHLRNDAFYGDTTVQGVDRIGAFCDPDHS